MAALDEVAGAEGVSRAELVRRLIDRWLGAEQGNLAADVAAIEGSFGALRRELEPPAREPDVRSAHLERIRRA